tara:strand:+ start:3061 stop:3288 length:228 start_codon:yes stop_codon:yes gene_type:complete
MNYLKMAKEIGSNLALQEALGDMAPADQLALDLKLLSASDSGHKDPTSVVDERQEDNSRVYGSPMELSPEQVGDK